MCFSVNQIDDLQSSNQKVVMNLPSSVFKTPFMKPPNKWLIHS